ncbi:MAG: glycosyltransferase family 2 protein [Armatimonadetes bacterium]|nr:glycosyltransferase family 2 protein [Armatimonadota bacterium]
MADIELTIVMPVYNERPTVLEILRRVRELPISKEIIIVDNCSTDGTRELLQGLDYPDVKLILQPRNMMKGNSVKRGMGLAQGEYVVVQDGDLEYDPQDLLKLLEALKQEGVLAVIGSRLLGARERGEVIPRTVFRLGGDFVNWVFQVLYRSPLTDIASCYKMAPRSVLQRLDLRCDGFDLDFETAAKLQILARREGKRIVELPIHYAPRTSAQGKKIKWQDGLKAVATLWRTRWWKPSK